jgi:hypothetical protein
LSELIFDIFSNYLPANDESDDTDSHDDEDDEADVDEIDRDRRESFAVNFEVNDTL